MLFNSYVFLGAFLPAVIIAFQFAPQQRLKLLVLLVASYVFYAYGAWWYPALMAASTAIAFAGGLVIERARGRARSLALFTSVALVLSLLVAFKYAPFLAHYSSRLVETLTGTGLPSVEELTRGILLPVGISFYTFEAISYLVDIYRGKLRAERSLLHFALFISFFPHLVAGPIVRYHILRPQLDRRYRFDADAFWSGLALATLGLAKKILIADTIARRIDPLLLQPGQLGAIDAWMVMIGFSFQIYFDFAGYTDMALGLARMFGIELPWNFDRPYRAASPTEFWRSRWHVTLSSWLRDYLYIPLGGNRKGKLRRDINLFATMGLGGLWHGASLNFGAWGLYQGTLLFGHHRLSGRVSAPRWVAVPLTFTLITLGWVLFRLQSRVQAVAMFKSMFGANGFGDVVTSLLPALAIAAILMWFVPEEREWSLTSWGWRRATTLGALAGVVLILLNNTSQFIYYKF